MAALRRAALAASVLACAVTVPMSAGAQDAGPTQAMLVNFHETEQLDDALASDLDGADPGAERVDDRTAVAELTPPEVAALRDDPDVAVVEPDAPVYAADVPNDPCVSVPASCGGDGAWHVWRTGLTLAWSLSHGVGATIAVIDSGVNALLPIPELGGGKLEAELTVADGPVCTSDQTLEDHGTEVATVAAAVTNNSIATAGSGWDARVLSIRIFEEINGVCQATISDIVTAIDLARARGAEVINLSATTKLDSAVLRQAIGRALADGIPVVAAAGNAGATDPMVGNGGYPAFYPEVIAVGSTDLNPNAADPRDPRATFSNFGSWVDVYAAGVLVPASSRAGALVFPSGTSFSAPVVAGIVALMRSLYPAATPAQIASHLRAFGTPLLNDPSAVTVNAAGALFALPLADVLLRDNAFPGGIDRAFSYGLNSYDLLLCDFNGDGLDGIVAFAAGAWYARATATAGPPQASFSYGTSGYRPVCGDWNGDGVDGIGVYVGGNWYLRETATPGPPQYAFAYGTAAYVPVVGNWDGVGPDGIGVFDDGSWYLRNTASPGAPHIAYSYGAPGYVPVVGNWDGVGPDGTGVYVGGSWLLRETPSPGSPQRSFGYGVPGWRPIVGATGSPGIDGVGVVVP